MVRAENLYKAYGKVQALVGISFDLHPGEVLGILGPNGAGKSTLLSIIARLIQADSGRLEVPAPRNIGFAPEEPAIWPDLTPKEQCQFLAGLYGLGVDDEFVRNHLNRFGIQEYADRLGKHLSLGNRKRLNTLLSALHQPSLLILDEPFNGLDEAGREYTHGWINQFVDGGSVLLASHQIAEVHRAANRCIHLDHGKEKQP